MENVKSGTCTQYLKATTFIFSGFCYLLGAVANVHQITGPEQSSVFVIQGSKSYSALSKKEKNRKEKKGNDKT